MKDYILKLFTDWCESSPYGEHIPDEWPELMAAFVKENAGKDRDQMAELLMEGDPESPFERLLQNIFTVSCEFVIRDLSDAVSDNDLAKLEVIGIGAKEPDDFDPLTA